MNAEELKKAEKAWQEEQRRLAKELKASLTPKQAEIVKAQQVAQREGRRARAQLIAQERALRARPAWNAKPVKMPEEKK